MMNFPGQTLGSFQSPWPWPIDNPQGIKKVKNKGSHLEDDSNFFISKNSLTSEKGVESILKIAKFPRLQAKRISYSYPNQGDSFPSSSIPFANWSPEQQTAAIKRLQELDIPLPADFLQKIYTLLQNHQQDLCQNSKLTYPALFEGKAYDQNEAEQNSTEGRLRLFPSKQRSWHFDLEIHTDKKASLIFRQIKKTHIESGTAKEVWKAYSLGRPKVIAYLASLPSTHSLATTSPLNRKELCAHEEEFLIQLQDLPNIAKAYRIFYYPSNQSKFEEQQIIEMKYYSSDLLMPLMETETMKNLSEQTKMSYSLQLIEAIAALHKRGILHRDLKPDNVLISKKGSLVLTDFGLSRSQSDPSLLYTNGVGSGPYIAPEVLYGEPSKYEYGPNIDIWSAGCILWLLWYYMPYPWYREAIKENQADINHSKILLQMYQFEKENSKFESHNAQPKDELGFLIWNMLRFDHNFRWNLDQVKDHLLSLKKKLDLNSSLRLTKDILTLS